MKDSFILTVGGVFPHADQASILGHMSEDGKSITISYAFVPRSRGAEIQHLEAHLMNREGIPVIMRLWSSEVLGKCAFAVYNAANQEDVLNAGSPTAGGVDIIPTLVFPKSGKMYQRLKQALESFMLGKMHVVLPAVKEARDYQRGQIILEHPQDGWSPKYKSTRHRLSEEEKIQNFIRYGKFCKVFS